MIKWLATRRWAKGGLSGLSGVLLLGAIGLFGWPFFSGIYNSWLQHNLAGQFGSGAIRKAYLGHRVGEGQPLTRIKIPAIGVNSIVVEGTSESALRAGAGHYPATALPCTVGNVAIAGHRTTYGRPFSNVDQLKVGDPIQLDTPIGSCTYSVTQAPFSVLPTDLSVVDNTPGQYTLTLTSCTPKGSASHRIILKAALRTTPALA